MRTKLTLIVVAVLFSMVSVGNCWDYGPYVYTGSVNQRDTLTILPLTYELGARSAVGLWVSVLTTTDLGAPMFETGQLLKYTATSGLMILDTASSSAIGFSADVGDGDVLMVSTSPPAGFKVRRAYTATQYGSGVDVLDGNLYVGVRADSIWSAAQIIRSQTDTEVAGIYALVDSLYYYVPYSKQKAYAPAAAGVADTTTLFNITGGFYIDHLSARITTQIAALADSTCFILDAGGTLTYIGRIDRGEEWNGQLVGTEFTVANSALGTTTTKTTAGAPVPVNLWRLYCPDGSAIKIVSQGEANTGAALITVHGSPAQPGGKITTP